MEKDDYKMEFEEQRKEIDLTDDEQVLSRVELHHKNKDKKKKPRSRFSLINVLLIIFTLIPIGIFASVIINLNTSKTPIEPTPEDDGLQIETSGKTNQDGDVILDKEEEEKKKLQEEAEQKEKEALAKADEEQKAEEERKAEEARQAEEAKKAEEARQAEERQKEEARQKELARQQAEKEKAEANKNQSNSNNQTGGKTHTVAPGETLYRISVNYYQNGDGVEKIKQANGLSSNSISVGQKLVIP